MNLGDISVRIRREWGVGMARIAVIVLVFSGLFRLSVVVRLVGLVTVAVVSIGALVVMVVVRVMVRLVWVIIVVELN